MAGELFDRAGRRLYLTQGERGALLAAAERGERRTRTFCLTLAWTGCRISEALALTVSRVDLEGRALVFETLKKRRRGVYRAVPVPAAVLDALDLVHGVREAQRRRNRVRDARLWSWARSTAWLRLKGVMQAAGIPDGPHRTAKGLRHGYGVHAISVGVPLNMLQKWMGHAQLETTAIYANALGAEERRIAERLWS